MNILFYSVKGGQGKTTHAVGYAKHADMQLCTNDFQNATVDIYGPLFPTRPIISLEPGQNIDSVPADNVVYDFGGFLDQRVTQAAGRADICVVPIFYQSDADLIPAAKTIAALAEYATNIVILINNTDKSHLQELKTELASMFPEYPIFVINHARSINRLSDE